MSKINIYKHKFTILRFHYAFLNFRFHVRIIFFTFNYRQILYMYLSKICSEFSEYDMEIMTKVWGQNTNIMMIVM